MQFRLLGNLEVYNSGGERVSLPPKLRTILSLLLVSENQIVPTGRFIDELWMGEPPATAMATIQTYVYQLRKLLGLSHGDKSDEVSLITEPAGYQLSIPLESVDVPVFEQAFQAGRAAFLGGEYERAANALSVALSLWRASALCDVQKGHSLEAYAAQLEESRIQATELRIEVYLKAGREFDAIRELQALIVAHPLHEGLHAKLMIALHRSGRRYEALDIYRRLRHSLASELGIDPSHVIQKLERGLLASDPALDLSEAGTVGRPAVVTVPAQLPADIPDFVARDFDLSRLEYLVTRGGKGEAPPIISITGMGGVGKTTLATRLAHRLRRRFPDGQFFTRLSALSGVSAEPREILGEFLFAIGFDSGQIPVSLEARSQLFRSWCADRRVLILLDDAAHLDQVKPIIPGGPQCAVIITNDSPLYGLSGAHNIELRPLEAGEAFDLFIRIAGSPSNETERRLARSIVEFCGNLPAAIRSIAGRLAISGNLSLERLASRLGQKEARLSEIASGGLDVRARFERSYVSLDAEAKLVLNALSKKESMSFRADDVSDVLGGTSLHAESILQRIYEARLLISDGSAPKASGYVLPDLVRLFVVERSQGEPDGGSLTARELCEPKAS
ncbi:AfsR/SARP family transcriptional regulator [Streptomyces lasalocidi]